MMMDIGKSFWGTTIDELSRQDAALLGLMDPGPMTAEGKTMLHERKDKKMNARQFMANERYGGNDTCMPAPPRRVEGCCPAHPSGYSDGGLANPSRQHFAVGGFGIFWPDAQNEQPPEGTNPYRATGPQGSFFTPQPWDLANAPGFNHLEPAPGGPNLYMNTQQWRKGIAQWSPMFGQWFSSTRIELAGAIMASLIQVPVHIASDSLAVVKKATK